MSETSKLWTLDQLLRQRAIDEDQTPLIAFPKTRQGYTDYEPITGATLNRFVDGTAKCLIEKGFQPVKEEVVIGICSPTDLDYIVNIFGLIRLGYTVFQLSPRLPPSAIRELLAKIQNGRRALLYAPAHTSFKLDALSDLELHPLVQRDEYDNSRHSETPEFLLEGVDYEKEHRRRCLILHSSGSTGLPKPIDYNHQKLLAAGVYAQDATAFISMPFSHALGMMSYMQAIHKRRTIYAMSGYVPQTHDTVTAAVKAANPDIMWTVPYVLKLLAEKPDGIDAIKNCRFVSSGGSKLPDELGDMLTEAGVHIGMQFGSTETGLILSSAYRPREDKAWNYLRPPAHVVPYIMFKPVDHDKYECVVLDGHKGKTMSNSDDPPNSWRTSDLFVPHPILPNAWKFVGRLDDRITLINGEKVLPLSIEARIKQSPLVREAVVFGIGREVPGLLLFRELGTSQLDDKEFLDQVWPTIEYANSHAESFSQINREMVAILPMDVECPLTDKNSIKRGLIYEQFADLIDSIYAAAESSNKVQSLQLTIPELENWILENVRAQGYEIEDVTTDFFTAGMDSLQAIHLRGVIIKNLDLGGRESECTSMIVFDCGNTQRLARRLHAIRTGDNFENEKDMTMDTMKRFIDKYGAFAKYEKNVNGTLSTSLNDDHVVILTGVTGFLGAHILAALVASSSVSKVYAFMRPNSEEKQTPLVRLESSLQTKGFSIPLDKVIPLYADITEENFGLKTTEMYKTMKSLVTHIIHCAWAVNFAIQLTAFEPQLLGLHNLLAFGLESDRNAHLLFCSSIGTAQATPGPATIASAMIPSFDNCSSMGYSQSKLVGEHIVESASKNGANATVLRIGQIIPGRRRGTKLWNPSEAMPLMIRSASKDSTGALPILDTGRDTCDWIEADTLADTILQLAGIDHAVDSTELVYNLVNPRVFSWKDDLLPSLHRAGLKFDTIPWQEWLDRLEASIEDANTNPSRKLLGFWRRQTHRDGTLTFDTAPAEAASPALRESLRVVDDNFIGQIIESWKNPEIAAKAQ
ncbi:NRPS-like enzyme, putative [Talaromyces stipitatus ATCC 10500]|uniref:NRPS-like enzyme, putative n=1 Tax=Talaromyces stipitatus (strain ATCC 10500 / CBS 375.48 / QM 6759 / NRRL 1006) TaxID=441959 RepID=B8ML74_TALSN|nr:NRPS-like enzyme, putative [Talaromyces stipitatus ATCC 10500]EED14989.1 NRPS-like enzyme, putative [Talaromyces stipitatus ATCC 10500]